jgi:ubiquinone/menaquinone biosynthesis C-methylase UbiE
MILEGNLHLAPISSNPHNVLDIATGTGLWAIEFGKMEINAIHLSTYK